MSHKHNFISPVNQSLCAKVNIPVVLSEADVEITVDNVICLPELAVKVDRIVASVRDVEGEPVVFGARFDPTRHKQTGKFVKWKEKADFVKRVVVHGVLHKQIFYVNRDNMVKHVGEDVPFSKTVDLEELEAVEDADNITVQVHNVRSRVEWNLIKSSRVHQTGFIRFRVKVVEERQLYVQLCPEAECIPGVNLLRDPGFEHWADRRSLVFWGTSNVIRSTTSRSGSFAAKLGNSTNEPASLFQSVFQGIVPGFIYELCFQARRKTERGPVPSGGADCVGDCHDGGHNCRFSLTAEVIFFDRFGNQLSESSKALQSGQVPENGYQQFCLTTGRAPEDATNALVRFSFSPEDRNRCSVKIDDAVLQCLPHMRE